MTPASLQRLFRFSARITALNKDTCVGIVYCFMETVPGNSSEKQCSKKEEKPTEGMYGRWSPVGTEAVLSGPSLAGTEERSLISNCPLGEGWVTTRPQKWRRASMVTLSSYKGAPQLSLDGKAT